MVVEDLPNNAIHCILTFLDFKSILQLKAVSKRWHGILSQNEAFWREKFEIDFGEADDQIANFEAEYKLEFKWRFGEPKMTALHVHRGAIVNLKVLGSMIVSSSVDDYVQVWDMDAMKCVCEFCPPGGREVFSVALHKQRVFVGVDVGEIQVWDFARRCVCQQWKAHGEVVWDLCVSNDRLVSASWDDKVKIWDLDTYTCLQTFGVPDFKCFHARHEDIVCGTSSGNIHVLHQTDGLLYILHGPTLGESICANSKCIAACLDNCQIQVWDRATRERIVTFYCGGGRPGAIEIDERKVVCLTFGAFGGRMKMWDTRTWACIRTMQVSAGLAECMHYGRDKLIVGRRLGMVRVLDFACRS